ncbi:MAG: hypothetical protein WCK49_00090 [Myxococcaceae bacterium]
MKLLIMLFVSKTLFSLEIDEVRSNLANIRINLESESLTSQNKNEERTRLFQMFKRFTEELDRWDDEYLNVINDILNDLSDLLLDSTMPYTQETLNQLIATLEGYLIFGDAQQPLAPAALNLLRRTHEVAVGLDSPRHLGILARLIAEGRPELTALFNELQEAEMIKTLRNQILALAQELRTAMETDFPALENNNPNQRLPQDNRERITLITRIVARLAQLQNDVRGLPGLEQHLQNLIRMLAQGTHRLEDAERNQVIELIQARLHRNLWEPLNIEDYRPLRITHVQYAQVASSMRMMR